MQPTFIELAGKTIVGVAGNFIGVMSPQANAQEVIGALWGRLILRHKPLPATTYGVITLIADKNSMTHQDELRYIAGFEADESAPVPDGMEKITVPPGRYAVFTHKGSVMDLPQTVRFAYGYWLPRSGSKARNVPHLEVYDERFRPDSPDSEFDILIPV